MATDLKILDHNKKVWDKLSEKGYIWTVPVDSQTVEKAGNGEWTIFATPTIPIPKNWFPESFKGIKLLGLASGGGQQCPVFAALGADVTVFDNSPAQLDADRMVAERENLSMSYAEGDMADLSVFADNTFDLIFHPVSNSFIPDVNPVWREAFRVLKPGGILISGFTNPLTYLFDENELRQGIMQVKHKLPFYGDQHLKEEELNNLSEKAFALEYSHTLEDQIGGQMKAGFVLTGMFEDKEPDDLLSEYTSVYIATRALKPASA
ncbi:MAG: class I SAM-dependent methyltransferase [Firmicutes bacterium]|nr:class I SAM-dependent methyltransferase [Bacillota bacterium]